MVRERKIERRAAIEKIILLMMGWCAGLLANLQTSSLLVDSVSCNSFLFALS